MVPEILQHRGNAAGDAAFHVDGAAAVEKAVFHLAGKSAHRPRRLIAGRHHIGMAGEGDMRRGVADARIKIIDIGGAGFAEGDPMGFETGRLEEIFQNAKRSGIGRSYRGAADEIAGDREGISHAPA